MVFVKKAAFSSIWDIEGDGRRGAGDTTYREVGKAGRTGGKEPITMTTTTPTEDLTTEDLTKQLADLQQRSAGQSATFSARDLVAAGCCTETDLDWTIALGATQCTVLGVRLPEFEECGDDVQVTADPAQLAVLIGLWGCQSQNRSRS